MCEGRWTIGYKTLFKFHLLYWFYATLLCPNITLWVILFPSSTNNLLPGLSCYSVKWFGGLWINRNPSDPPSLPCYHPRPRPLGPIYSHLKLWFFWFFSTTKNWFCCFLLLKKALNCGILQFQQLAKNHVSSHIFWLTWKNSEHFLNYVILSNCALAHLPACLS